MEDVRLVLDIIKYVVIGLGFLLSLVMANKSHKNKEWYKKAEQLNQLQKEIMSYIPLAEQFVNSTGS